jgi:ribosomal protein L33
MQTMLKPINNTDNDIFIFQQENITFIKEDYDFLCKCTRAMNSDGFATMAQKIWFNDDIPQNNNIKYRREMWPRLVWIMLEDEDGLKQWEQKIATKYLNMMAKKIMLMMQECHEKIYIQDKNKDQYEWREEKIYELYKFGHVYKRQIETIWIMMKNEHDRKQ